ncbi:Liver carboxylesterase 1 [Seminavis robusta]|uniref:Carboxylic ester hydrolase n=1 Tax=Seminavis robusta TaxID=568900 RepID=A0A9N8EVW0_9STRA|nr:Liver carboxylesterase 1 [Seminavis robusta]|eukprot:Sro2043_g312330.1 Liver carboxylesterase 1 (637) ;mRNA; f:3656-5566
MKLTGFTLAVAFATAKLATAQTPLAVDFPTGASVIGSSENGVDSFLGIQYATVGDRFSRSIQLDLPDDVETIAKEYGSNCHQAYPGLPEFLYQPRQEAEECLYLNIWRPSNISLEEPLPIMVWIHGGGFMIGSGADAVYNGSNLARSQHVMVITLNYRLGALGFLPQDDTGVGAMNGIYDQLMALKWVQSNAAGFGGNVDEVTLLGESAGGESICMLSVSPLAKGLFHRAVLQSGECRFNHWMRDVPNEDYEYAFEAVSNLINATGVVSLDELKNSSLVDAASLNFMSAAVGWSVIVLDREILPEHPRVLYEDPENIVPSAFLVGANSNEDTTFMGVSTDIYLQLAEFGLNESIHSLVGSMYGSQIAADVWDAYNAEDNYDNDVTAAFSQFHGDWYIRCPTRAFASHVAPLVPENVYMYNFAHFSITDPMMFFGLAPFVDTTTWSSHLAMNPFVFGTLDGWVHDFVNGSLTQEDWDLSDEIMTRFANFAKSGNPNVVADQSDVTPLVEWKPVTAGRNEITTSFLRSASSSVEASNSSLPVLVFSLGTSQLEALPEKTHQCAAFPFDSVDVNSPSITNSSSEPENELAVDKQDTSNDQATKEELEGALHSSSGRIVWNSEQKVVCVTGFALLFLLGF